MTTPQEFKAECEKYGWNINIKSDTVISISKSFTPGDMTELVKCDGEYYHLLSMVPLKGGSIWGTDCGGIGAMSALKSGLFVMNKSGNSGKRFIQALKKIA
jgi:hypothetical protein